MLTIEKQNATQQATLTDTATVSRQQPKLLDRMREAIRVKHYALATERTYIHWAKRFILFHNKRHPAEMGAPEVEAFRSALATERNVSASTQNQAMHAVLYLYKNVLGIDLPWLDNVVRAKESKRLPAVLTQRETAAMLRHVHGTSGTIVKLLYGTGMRLLEGLRLRIKDLDLERREITIRAGKGDKDRVTVLPASLIDELRDHLAARRIMHDTDLATGHADVELPDAIERKYPKAGAEWAWQYVFAAKGYSTCPRTGTSTSCSSGSKRRAQPLLAWITARACSATSAAWLTARPSLGSCCART